MPANNERREGTSIAKLTDDGIWQLNPLPGHTPEQHRRCQLECYLGVIEQWRAVVARDRIPTDENVKQSTLLIYQSNAIERELWKEVSDLTTHRRFLPIDAFGILNGIRERIISEMNGSFKKQGRRRKSNRKADESFKSSWIRAKESKIPFKDFCNDNGKSAKEGRAILARLRMAK